MHSQKTRRSERGASLMSLQPVDDAPLQRPVYPAWLVWGSLVLVWMASMLPWRLWSPVPDVMLLMLAFWCLHEPARVGLTTAFVFGLLLDVHDAGLLGLHALCYVLATYGVMLLYRRLQQFSAFIQTLHVWLVFIVASLVTHLLDAWLRGTWMGWSWLWSAIITGALWPLVDVLVSIYQRRHGDDDVGAV